MKQTPESTAQVSGGPARATATSSLGSCGLEAFSDGSWRKRFPGDSLRRKAFAIGAARHLSAVTFAVLLSVNAIAGALEDGITAYKRGNYAEAFRLLQPLAGQGEAVAQEVLGVMYAEGQGVQKNEDEAVKLFRRAADQGNDLGQYNLGAAYVNGLGVPKDYVLGQMWFILAAAQGFEPARSARNKLTQHMTPDEIAEAQRLAREWKPTIPSP